MRRRIIPTPKKGDIAGRQLKKTVVEKRIFERAVGLTRPNVYSHRNNIQLNELPY